MKKILFALSVVVLLPFSASHAEMTKSITVYKNPQCGCCIKWIRYLEDKGYKVEAINTRDIFSVKKKLGVPEKLASCHTAIIDGYVIEGHAKVRDIRKLLVTRPDVKGIAVPGMPIGTPGMEKGSTKEAYDVISFDKDGKTEVFQQYR